MPVTIEFDGLGDNLLASVKKQRDALVGLKQGVDDANAAIKSGATENAQAVDALNDTIDTTAKLIGDIGSKSDAGLGKMSKDAGAAAKSTDGVVLALIKAKGAADALSRQQKQITQDAEKIRGAVAKGTISQHQANKAVAQLAKEYSEVTDQLGEVNALIKNGGSLLEAQDGSVKTLKAQFTEAKNEAAAMISKFGEFSPEAVEATKKAAGLKDQIADLNDRLNSLNPDSKLASFAKLGTVIGSGAQAFGGFIAAFSKSGGPIQEAALKLQSFVLGLQGANQFILGFSDAVKDVRIALGLVENAQVASTVATQADVVAKGEQAAATRVVTTANSSFIASLNALKAALLSNPITAILVGLAALVAGIVIATSDTREYTKAVEDLNDQLDETTQKRLKAIDNRAALQAIESEKRALEEGDTEAAKRRQSERDYLNERAALVGKQLENELNIRTEIAFLESLDGKNSDEAIKARIAATDALKKYSSEFESTQQDIKRLEGNQENDRIRQSNADRDRWAQDAKERLAIRQRTAEEIAALEKQLAERVAQAQLQAATPRERLAMEQKLADDEIDQLRTNLLRKLAEIQLEKVLGVKAIKEMSEAQLKAREDALIAKGAVNLPASTEEEINKLKLLNQQDYNRKSAELTRQDAETRIQLIRDAGERETATFEAGLAKRVDELKKAGATDSQVLQFQLDQRDAFTKKQVLQEIDATEQIATANIEGQRRGAESEAAFKQRVELEKLAAQEVFVKARLKAIENDGSTEASVLRAQFNKQLAAIGAARAELQSNIPSISIFKLLGIDGLTDSERAEFNKNLATIRDGIQQGVDAVFQAQISEVEARISATDMIIEDAQRRTDELQNQLNTELDAQSKGLANNVDSVRAAIEAQRQLEEKAMADQKRLIAEKNKLAKEQAIADSLIQASSLVTATASLFKEGALAGIPGIIAAIAFGSAMIGSFLSIKAKIKSATTFEKGGAFRSPFIMDGPSHAEGGLGIYNERTGQRVAEAEGNEGLFFLQKKHKGLMPILEAVNDNDMARTAQLAIRELTGGMNIGLEPDMVSRMVSQKERYNSMTTVVSVNSNKALEKGVRELTGEVRGFRGDSNDKEAVDVMADGSRVVSRKGSKRITKPKK